MEIKINNSYKREKKKVYIIIMIKKKKKKKVRTLHQTEITEVT